MVIKRYIVTIYTNDDECAYTSGMVASYVKDGLESDNASGVTAAVVDAEYQDEVVTRFDIREDSEQDDEDI
jgi:hypothetical protein